MSSQLQQLLARQLEEARAKLTESALNTSPADFQRLRKAVRKIYTLRGQTPPPIFLQCNSPAEAAAVVSFLNTRCGIRGCEFALPNRMQMPRSLAIRDAPANQWLRMFDLCSWFDAALPKKGEFDPAIIASRLIDQISHTKNTQRLRKQIPKIAEAAGLTPGGGNPLSMPGGNSPRYHAPPCDAKDLLLVKLLETIGIFNSADYQPYFEAFEAGGWWWTLEDIVVWSTTRRRSICETMCRTVSMAGRSRYPSFSCSAMACRD